MQHHIVDPKILRSLSGNLAQDAWRGALTNIAFFARYIGDFLCFIVRISVFLNSSAFPRRTTCRLANYSGQRERYR